MITNFGFDYGVKPRMILVSDQSFVEYFDKGKCIGMIYVNCPDSTGKLLPTEIGFNFEVEEYAQLFIETLVRWVEQSGNDERAVHMEFIDMKNGDYMVAFAQDKELFCKRMLHGMLEDRVDPILFFFYKGKTMQTGRNYAQFKQNYVQGRRIIVRAFVGIGTGAEEKILLPYFIKSSFQFSKEEDLPSDSIAHSLLVKKDKPLTKNNIKRKTPVDHEAIATRRRQDLSYFFPVTIDRINRQEWLAEVIKTIPPHFSQQQIQQAICNMILAERLKQESSELKTAGPGHDMNLLRYLVETIESFDSYFPPDNFFTKPLIKQQLKRDKDYLTDYLSKE
ncbi:hypothetical protein MKQ68_22395 [Chitinophaga horti]|uniref:DUF4123 domain-containing protein n=1 Tax=Chitinophaga horti TaxID=2920382 RepID=A0ABY6J3F5_9BACT|nr:hypothetical protein [Chitinophaga horti]UYQ92834.1 hypothetical protein MKQ68_22395 [Chitinophaga horti]